jgi:hypothetical protein
MTMSSELVGENLVFFMQLLIYCLHLYAVRLKTRHIANILVLNALIASTVLAVCTYIIIVIINLHSV